MSKLIAKVAGIFMLALSISVAPAFADENEVAGLKNQVNDLSGKVADLQRKLSTLATAPKESSYVVPSGQSTGGGLIHTVEDINMTGFIDTQWNANIGHDSVNPGAVAGSPGNPLRSFDNNQNTFSLNNAELDFEKLANPEGGAGFRLDISMGQDAKLINNSTIGSNSGEAYTESSDFAFQQAYIQAVAPLAVFNGSEIFGDTIDFKVGRFVTLAGAEVIEGKDNWNISRSFLFGLGVPITHTGIRSTYKLFNDRVTVYGGINNGWDANVDNNEFKTLETGLSFSPIEDVTWTSSIYWGPENLEETGRKRFLSSNVLVWNATDRLSFMNEFTIGNQRRVLGLEGREVQNAQWWGDAFYARYQLTEKFSVGARMEVFRDDDTFRSGLAGFPARTLWSPTFTVEYRPWENLITRAEFRHDKEVGDRQIPFDGETNQDTLGAQMIYLFA